MKQKRLIMMLAVLAAAGAAMAQGNGQAGITEATQLVTGYLTRARNWCTRWVPLSA